MPCLGIIRIHQLRKAYHKGEAEIAKTQTALENWSSKEKTNTLNLATHTRLKTKHLSNIKINEVSQFSKVKKAYLPCLQCSRPILCQDNADP